MPTLFQIGGDLEALAELLTEGGPELADQTAATVDAWFAELAGQEATKLDNYVSLIRKFEMETAAAKEEAERYQMIAKARENAAQRLKTRLHDYMALSGRAKLVTETNRTLKVCVNGGKEPLSVDSPLDLDAIPPELVRVTKAIDADAIRARLQAGEKFEWVSLAERGTHLRIG